MKKVKGCIVCNSEEFIEFLKGCNNDLAEVFGMAEESDDVEESLYSYRRVLSVADYDKAVGKAAFLTILMNSDMDDSTIKALADMANYLGVALFGETYEDSKTEKEEN